MSGAREERRAYRLSAPNPECQSACCSSITLVSAAWPWDLQGHTTSATVPRLGEASSPAVLVVTDFLHPLDDVTVKFFLNGDVRHGRGWCGAVPVLLAGRDPDHITRPYLLDWFAFALDPATACRDDEGLTERMRMLGSPCTRLESDAGTLNKCRIRCLKKRSIRTVPVNHSDGPLTEGCEPILLISIFCILSLDGFVIWWSYSPKPLESVRQLWTVPSHPSGRRSSNIKLYPLK